MSELAVKRMTLAEFLRWEDGTDTRYERLPGFPVAMAPPAVAHGILAARLRAGIEAALRSRRPCMAQVEAGIEILSPGSAMYDRQTKLADYRRIPSVDEILLVDSAS